MRYWLVVCGLVVSAVAWADDLGRLFTTPGQRTQLERPAPERAQAPAARQGRATVQRRDGTQWVISDGRRVANRPAPAQASTEEEH
jgi:hypothetical protein